MRVEFIPTDDVSFAKAYAGHWPKGFIRVKKIKVHGRERTGYLALSCEKEDWGKLSSESKYETPLSRRDSDRRADLRSK